MMAASKSSSSGSQLWVVFFLVGLGVIYQLVFHCVDVLRKQGNEDVLEESRHFLHMRGSALEVTNEAHADLSDMDLEQLGNSIDNAQGPKREPRAQSMPELYAASNDDDKVVDLDGEQVQISSTFELARKIKARKQTRSMADMYQEPSLPHLFAESTSANSKGLNIRRNADAIPAAECVRPSPSADWIEMLELQVAHQCARDPTADEVAEMYTSPGGMRLLMSRLADNRASQSIMPAVVDDVGSQATQPTPVKLGSRRNEQASPRIPGRLDIRLQPQECVRPSAADEWIEALELQVARQCAPIATPDEMQEMYTAPGGMRRLISRLANTRADQFGGTVTAAEEKPAASRSTAVKLGSRSRAPTSLASGMVNILKLASAHPPDLVTQEAAARRGSLRLR